ncbi:MAG: YggS family pyridoxal phosphate-dependent enzyme [Opitutaceae bacterium]|jgi:pyridoxal phosphate enzyme (YggS family)|nr:YggS family pyridoxal phosphate-dependent enzyme [Opitutaceae bacterium]
MITYEQFSANVARVGTQIAAACAKAGRLPSEVTLLAVTKTHPADAVEYAARHGLRSVGENRVQEGVDKRAHSTAPIRWELIGHLQSNKAALAAAHFDRIQSVDTPKLLARLDAAAAGLGKTLAVLLQINAGRDEAKFGAEIEDAPRLLDVALTLPHLRVDGLMTIAPLSDDPDVAKRAFEALRTLRDDLVKSRGVPLNELSMGMSGDMEAAIAAGSTCVRIGTALYGARE